MRTRSALAIALALGFVVSALLPFGGFLGAAAAPASSAATHASAPLSTLPRSTAAAALAPTLPHAQVPKAPLNGPDAQHGGPMAAPTAAPSAPPSHPSPGAASSGRGTFFTTESTPLPTNATPAYGTTDINDTSSPAIAVTPSGNVVLAYTAFTNETPCPGNSSHFASTEIGVLTSSNNGSSWSSPQYLGNPVCSQAYNFTSAWQPSVAVLPNGTFVMVYIEYNSSLYYCTYCIIEGMYGSYFYSDALVVTYSYNNGATWTTPYAINVTLNPTLKFEDYQAMLPQVAVSGNTVYVLWENYTYPSFYYDASTALHMVVSTNGSPWANATDLPVIPGTYYSEYWYSDNNPFLMVGPNGKVFVAYTTAYTISLPGVCQPQGCTSDYWDALSVVVASSVNNGTSWTLKTLMSNLPWEEDEPGYGFVDTAPQLAYDPVSGNLYATWIGYVYSAPGYCYTYPTFTGCDDYGAPAPWFAVSTNLGATWSTPSVVSYSLDDPYGGTWDMSENVGIGVNSTGAIFISDLFTNDSICETLYYGLYCGATGEVMLTSTNHGASFTGPYPVGPSDIYSMMWPGITSPFVTLANNLTNVFSDPTCPAGAPYGCYWISGYGASDVTLTQLYNGAGVTVTFNETGLPPSAPWTAILTGNVRTGAAGTDLTVSGVPTGQNQTWQVEWVNTTYGHAFVPSVSPVSPGLITGTAQINATYDPYVKLIVTTVPTSMDGAPFTCPTAGYYFEEMCTNQQIYPQPGSDWVPQGAVLPYNVTEVGFSYYCYYCYNLTFQAWTGSGQGSWNTTNPNGSTIVLGPVNETASFLFDSTCTVYGTGATPTCTNLTYNYLFTENGLPNGTNWEVTLNGTASSSTSPAIAFSEGQGPYNFTIWNVPINSTWSYVGTASYPSPITALQGATEVVTFVPEPNAALASGVSFTAAGLPSGVSDWSLVLDGTTYGISPTNSTFTLLSGNYTLNANDVYGANGVGAFISSFYVVPSSVNAVPFTVLPGGNLTVEGPVTVTAVFSSEYYVTVSWSVGGTVSPDTIGWVHAGVAVNLTATPSAGYALVGWTGTGAGSATATTPLISLAPEAPVTEFATFVAVIPTYVVTVASSGLHSGDPVTLSLGGASYTEVTPFAVSGLTAGEYALTVPTVYPNATTGVRYDPTSVAAGTPLTLTDGNLDVTANGTLTITYQASYALTVTPAVNGTTSPAAGTYWESGAVSVPFSASPFAGHSFSEWVGIGAGSMTGTNASFSLTLTAPITETAYFTTNPYVPPATYTVTVSETGLPTGVTWSASIGSNGGSATAPNAIVLSGLNGSYTLSVPTLSASAGVRYAPTYNGNVSTSGGNTTASATFVTQYEVSVSASAGGTVTASAQWVTSGTMVTLTATAATGDTFISWNGTGTGSYTGTLASTSVTVTAPISEVATFVPSSSIQPASSSSSSGSWLLPIALLVVLLVVGLVVGLLIARSRPPSGGAPAAAPEADTSSVPVWTETAETTENQPSAPPSSGDADGGDTVYGGGSA